MKKLPISLLVRLLLIPIAAGYAYLFGVVSRMMGGGVINLPDIADKALFGLLSSLPFLLIGYFVEGHALAHWEIAAAVLVVTTLTCNMGHADFFYVWKGERDQTMSPVVIFLYERFIAKPVDRTDWRYDAIGMALVGVVATLPTGIGLIVAGHPIAGAFVGLSGISKAYAYRDGFSANPVKRDGFTEPGEWRRGWYYGSVLMIATVSIVLFEAI